MKRVVCVSPLLVCLAACGTDGMSDTLDTGVTSNSSCEGAGDGDGDAETGGVPFEPVPARGVTLTRVTANHGINVDIAVGDQWVDGFGRNGRLATGRDTLIRVYYTLD